MNFAQRSFIFWGLAFGALVGFIYIFQSVLLPFALGLIVAYLLNPAVNSLARVRLSRGPAAISILASFLIFMALLAVAMAPVLYRQLLDLAHDIPIYADGVLTWLEPKIRDILSLARIENQADLKAVAKQVAVPAMNAANFIAAYFIQGVAAGAQILSVVFVMPIVAYFMMKEWPNITRWFIDLLPRGQAMTILDLLKQIDRKIAGFIRGQLLLALVLAICYAVALSLAGLKYGFLIGLLAGGLSIIPMLGSTIGFIAGIAVAWVQTSGDWSYMALIAGIFIAGQIIEGNFLTPKLIGDSVGLHPLWIFFALLAGASMFGILGMLIAVPVAAIISVLAAFAIQKYKASPYYNDHKPDPVKGPDAKP